MSELLTFRLKKMKGGSSTQRRGRKGSIIIDDGNSKKRVRFNISSTIYEEVSAIYHDESDSMIEPLSIYSYNSPPGELNDDIIGGAGPSSSRSLSMPTVHERRNSEGGIVMNESLNSAAGSDDDDDEADDGIRHHHRGAQIDSLQGVDDE